MNSPITHHQKCIDAASIPSVSLLCQIVLDTHLFNLIYLGLDPVDVFLFFLQDRCEKHFGVIIPHLSCYIDAIVVTSNSRFFSSMIILMHIWNLGADDYLIQFADDWLPFKENNSGDRLLRVSHFGDGSFLDNLF